MRKRTNIVKAHVAGDAEAAMNVLFELWRVARAAGALVSKEALSATGLSGDEFGVYSLLASGEKVTPSVLERWMSARKTTVSSYINRLEARGHVTRTTDPADGRSWVLQLTPAGQRAHAKATKKYLPVLERVVDHLGTNEPNVLDALGALREAITAARTKGNK